MKITEIQFWPIKRN